MKRRILIGYFIFGLLLFFSKNSFAQNLSFENKWSQINYPETNQSIEVVNEHSINQKKWNLEIGAGFISGPYVTQLKDVFKAIGLKGCYDTFFGQECYPKKDSDVAFMASISRDVLKNVAIGATLKKSLIGGVEGTHGKKFSGDGFSVAPIVIVQIPKTWWSIGVGPSYHNFNIKFSDFGSLVEAVNHKKMGFLMDAGMAVPSRGVIFGKLNLSYLYLGEIKTGNYEITDLVSGVKTTIPSTSISFNQFMITLGFGFRL
ncbi:MAG: hypothetical protein IPH94_20555 [Saprospiraceae bacterium]|nr:hypothetical protein [Saprospiraceae bacterium]